MSSTLDAVLERLEALHPKAIDLSLDRVLALLADFGHPQRRLPPTVHVAGTNGKGSTIAFMRAMLERAGRRVHVYTSPHLVDFSERILLAGKPMSDDAIADLLAECERVNADRQITFFEIVSAAAFLAFSRHPADVLLLEVGLGGRLDTTNVIERPAVTAIAPVSLDHKQFLGETIDLIAREKAGIAKAGVPLVLAPQVPEARRAIEAVAGERGPVYADWRIENGRFEGRGLSLDLPKLGLEGAHQAINAGLALACLEGFDLPRTALLQGLSGANWPGRLQRISENPEIWLDGGHNPAAGETLSAWLGERGEPFDLVVGMLDTKDNAGFLAPLARHVVRVATVPVRDSRAGLDPGVLAGIAREAGLDAAPSPDIDTALARLGGRPILIAGSLYLAGEVLRRR